MSYRYGNSNLDYLYDEMKEALTENGIDVFMQMVSDALTGVFTRMVDEKTSDIVAKYDGYRQKVEQMEKLLIKEENKNEK